MVALSKQQKLAALKELIDSKERGARLESPFFTEAGDGEDPSCDAVAFPSAHERLEEEADRAYAKILRLLSYRDRSSKEMRERLSACAFSEAAIEAAMKRATHNRVIDDERYAQAFMESRYRSGKGEAGAKRDLLQKGFAAAQVEQLVAQSSFSDTDELSRALEYLRCHPSRSKNIREGSYRKLLYRGFSSSVSAKAASMAADAGTED